ncbi:ATP-binding cassette domain-containing protein [uncultured Jatrophihabitans sp.]|uniref:ATP-binding cassette domain-containing protein n=1 Tax=uncultured Jatrophihabitans sp. TaxID=1610747 RepID=UPI0035CB22E0
MTVQTLTGSGLAARRAGQDIFTDLSFEARAGTALAVLGPSGSGKTTLLALVGGLARPDAGTVLLDGAPIDASARRRIGVVLQGYGLVALLSAAENVEAALRASGMAAEDAQQAAADALAALGLESLADHLIEELSGGQQQRVAVARALALAPDVLLADEPTAEQDPESRAVVLAELFSVPQRGGILLLATHDAEIAERCTASVHVRD